MQILGLLKSHQFVNSDDITEYFFYFVFSGGNCNTGPNAERFLGPKLREHVVKCYNFDTDVEDIRFGKLLKNLNCIIRVLGSWRRKARPCPY